MDNGMGKGVGKGREMVDPTGNERSPSVTAAVVKEDEVRV